jgi:hypothetical protein
LVPLELHLVHLSNSEPSLFDFSSELVCTIISSKLGLLAVFSFIFLFYLAGVPATPRIHRTGMSIYFYYLLLVYCGPWKSSVGLQQAFSCPVSLRVVESDAEE